MSKRFTDTNKYKKKFIRELPLAYKVLWDYLYHDCDHSGIWHVNFDIAKLYIGGDIEINEDKALELFNKDEERVIVLNGGSKWFIIPFIRFQYGALDSNNRVHKSVLDLLHREQINKGLISTLKGCKDKDKDKDKNKDKEIWFLEYWKKYPAKGRNGKDVAFRRFLETVKNKDDFELFKKSFNNFVNCDRVKKGFIRRGSAWFGEWDEWIDYKEEQSDKDYWGHL